MMHSSGNSKPNLVVKDIRFATMLMEKSKRIGNVKETGLYAVPLTRSSAKIDTATFNRCVFDAIAVRENARPFQMDRMEEHKTILLMGAPDSGKTSIIHSLFNFIVGVDLKDPFRFLLKEDGQDETQSISVYEIHYADGFRIPYPLTIIDVSFCYDTPSKEFSEILGKFFLCEDAVQQLDMVGLVPSTNSLPTKCYESLLSFFGKDLKDNFNILSTFAYLKEKTSQSNTFLESLSRHELPNLEFFSSNGYCDPSLRRNQWKAFEIFFQALAKLVPNRLWQTKKVLEERTRLELTFGELRNLVENGTAIRGKILETKKIIADYQEKIKTNTNVKTIRKTKLAAGFLATNCNNCGVTCSVHRKFKSNNPSCSICPENCNWNLHSINVSYGLESTVRMNVPLKLETHSEHLEKLVAEERNNSINQKVLRCKVTVYIKELDKIALLPFIMTPEYAVLMT